jgi:toxin ParE1/3/4
MYKILFTKQMEKDLKAIYDYIAFTLFAPDVAAGQLDRIEKAIMKLQEMPERYRLYEEEPWRSKGLRRMPVDNFIALYIPRNDDKTVTVIRVLYSGSNIDEQIKDYGKRQATNELKNKLDKGRKLSEEITNV